MYIVHGAAPSPFVRKVRVFLTEKGLDYEHRELIPFPKTPELLEMNPLGKVPIFQDGDFITPDSSVICAYIERLHPERPVYPKAPQDFARALWLEEYADTKLVETVGRVFFQRVISPMVFQQPTDDTVVQAILQDELPPALDYLEKQVGGRPFAVGDAFSIADISLCAQLVNLQYAGESIDTARWPGLAAYVGNTLGQSSFKAVLTNESENRPG